MGTLHCPYCGGKFSLNSTISAQESETEQFLRRNLILFLRGHVLDKGYIERIDDDTYKFRLQTYDSPYGDTWIEGVVYWCPPYKFEIRDLNSWTM